MQVPPRYLPPPASVSPEARAYLKKTAELARPRAFPAQEDREGWLKLIEEANARILANFSRPPPPYVAIETVDVDGVVVHRGRPGRDATDGRVILEIHGGSLLYGGGELCRRLAGVRADAFGCEVWSVDYRTPPDHPYPAALEDCLTVYRRLLKDRTAEDLILSGSSAGGNLAAATVLKARDAGLPLPAAVVLVSPEVDLTESGDSFASNRGVDVLLGDGLMPINRLYAGSADLRDPHVSPLFGDFDRGFPPTLIQSGTRDLFLSNAVRLHRRLRAADVQADLHVFEAMPHGGFAGAAPEDDEVIRECRLFVDRIWQRKWAAAKPPPEPVADGRSG